MSASSQNDLSTIAPHLRPEVMRRVRAVESFLAAPGRDHAERMAEQLTISVSGFYHLVRAWKATPHPAALPGSGVRRPRSPSMTAEQLAIIEHAEALCADRPIAAVVDAALKMARAMSVAMPSRRAIEGQAHRVRPTRASPLKTTGGAKLMLSHCRVDVPVQTTQGSAVAPVAAILIAVSDAQAQPIGIALHPSEPNEATGARAILNALTHPAAAQMLNKSIDQTLLIASPPGHAQDELERALGDKMFNVRLVQRNNTSALSPTALLGRLYKRVRLKPRLQQGPNVGHYVTIPTGGSPMALSDAEALVRSRMLGDLKAQPSSTPGQPSLDPGLIERLRRVAGDR